MLRWAILGTGFISNAVIESIGLSDDSAVEIIAGRDDAKVADFQARHGIARSANFEDALADPNVDVVYIGLPNHQHHPYVIAAAGAGKAVLSEKSLTTKMSDAHALVGAVATHGTFFVEGLMYLAHPVHQRFVKLLEDGRLGQLRSIQARYGANINHLVNPAGRGTIYNLGCYPVSLTHLVVQTVRGDGAFADRSLLATGLTHPDNGTVTDAALVAQFAASSDAPIVVTIESSDSYGNTSHFAIAGSNGVLSFETNPWLPVAGDNVIIWQPHDGAPERITVSDDHDAFYHQIKMVERHVNSGHAQAERPSPRHADSVEIMQLLTEWEAACLDF